MDIIRRNSDYSLRLSLNLAQKYRKEAVSARTLSKQEKITYHLTCKLLQRLHRAGFVDSKMGPKGGYYLVRPPSEISLNSIIDAVQGPIRINRCIFEKGICHKQPDCPISRKLSELQHTITFFLKNTTLSELC